MLMIMHVLRLHATTGLNYLQECTGLLRACSLQAFLLYKPVQACFMSVTVISACHSNVAVMLQHSCNRSEKST